jgi:hypothetical protein
MLAIAEYLPTGTVREAQSTDFPNLTTCYGSRIRARFGCALLPNGDAGPMPA